MLLVTVGMFLAFASVSALWFTEKCARIRFEARALEAERALEAVLRWHNRDRFVGDQIAEHEAQEWYVPVGRGE